MTDIYHIRVTLRDTRPPIWRRVAVPADISLGQLHEVIQIAMGWTDSHLHQFILEDKSLRRGPETIARLTDEGRWDEIFTASRGIRTFVPTNDPFGGDLAMEGEDENAATLAELLPQRKGKSKAKLIYEYDFGDSWQHTVEVQKVTEPESGVEYPVCLTGRRACPPEDCGGVFGYEHLLEVAADPEHEDREEMEEWIDQEWEPAAFDLDEANAALAEWRRAQQGSKR